MKKTWLQAILCFCCIKLCFAAPAGNQCNYERESPGSWYGDVNMLGPVNREGFSRSPYSKWFLSEYRDYQPAAEVISTINKNRLSYLDDLEITVFMGTWCSDSKKQTPRLYKILDQLNFDENRLSVHAVDIVPGKFRRTPDGMAEKGMNIYRVPTIILSKNRKEIGRIVEFPLTTLEQDILNILNEEGVASTQYALEGEVNNYLDKFGVDGFEKNINKMSKEFREKGIKEDELDHYIAYNLIYSNRYREATLVTKMMLEIFPEAGHLHLALAKTYDLLNNDDLALSSYRKAFLYLEEKGKMAIFRDAIDRSQAFE